MQSAKRVVFSCASAAVLALGISCSDAGGPGPMERTGKTSSALTASPQLPNFVLYAERTVTLGSGDLVIDGDVGVHNGSGRGGAQLTIGSGTVVDEENNLFAPAVSLGLLAFVGNVETNSFQNNGGFAGTVTSFPAAAMPQLPPAAASTPTGSNVTVGAFQIVTLSPGSYGALSVTGTLILNPGTYSFASVTLANAAHVWANPGGVSVRVRDTFTAGGLATFQPVFGQGAADLTISVSGLDNATTGSPAVSLGTGSTITGLLAAPNGTVSFGDGVFATGAFSGFKITAGQHVTLTFQSGFPAAATTPPPSTPAVPPPPLPPPPPPVVGCYAYTLNGWQGIPCATNAFIDSHFGHPDTQLTVNSSATPKLVYGQVAVTLPQVASENNAFLASTAGIPGCQSTGSSVPNQWSVQNNTNQFSVPSGTIVDGVLVEGHSAATQFTIQSDGTTSSVCIWNVDVTGNNYAHRKCAPQNPPQRAGGLQAFDQGNIAGFVNSNGTLGVVAQFSWSQVGQPNTFATVIDDTYKLAGGWTEVSGGIIGLGVCSQSQFVNTEVVTQVAASTCSGDTDATSTVCAPPIFQANASVFVGPIGTVETNNLTAVGSASLAWPNADLAVSNITGTTSGSCLGPSHAYVKDNAFDFGATPSNLGGQVFWESPDIFLVPAGTPVSLTAQSTETVITPGGSFDVWVRVHNDLGCTDVTGVKALVYLADPSALSVQWSTITNMQYVGDNKGSTGVTAPAGGEALIGPLNFTAPTTGIGNGHKCILAAIEADGESPAANSTDAPNSNQVAQRNIQFVGPCEYPLTNATTSSGNVQITLTVTPNTGTTPSLTASPDIEVTFDDADSSWFNVWNAQAGSGTTFSVTHNATAGSTTVRLGAFSVSLSAVPLGASQTRNATGTINLPSGSSPGTLQIATTLKDSGGTVLVTGGGSCTANAPVIQPPPM